MNIFPVNTNLLFSSKNPKVRLADDICRLSKREFPMFSDSYAIRKFCTLNSKDEDKKNRAKKLLRRVTDDMSNMRRSATWDALFAERGKKSWYDPKEEIWLKHIKNSNYGNCHEASQAALAALFANNYLNSEIVRLGYKSVFTDKRTGKVMGTEQVPLDHALVVSDMEKGDDEYNCKTIVIDPWLCFASGQEEACAKYKELFSEEFLEKQKKELRERFAFENRLMPNFDINNYSQRSGFCYMRDTDPPMAAQKRVYAEHIRSLYPNLVMKNPK